MFATQFLGAFNDNLFKNALVVLITYKLAAGADNAALQVTLAGGLFILPFFIFSATAGQLADKFDRARLTRNLKCTEFMITLIASAGFYFSHASFLMFVLFGLGVQATFFGPIKYALLPQHLKEDELIAGNGFVESGTFLAILLGTILGGLMVLQPGGTLWVSAGLVLVAIAGYIASRYIPESPPPEPTLAISWNIVAATWRMIGFSRRNRRVFLSILGISWFWLLGATLLTQFPPLAKSVLFSDETVVTLFYTAFSLGIGIGSMLCARISRGKISARAVPFAAIGMSLAIADCAFVCSTWTAQSDTLLGMMEFLASGGWRITLDLVLVSAFGGLFVVPLYALMQHESDKAHLARVIAANNILNALFMVISSVAMMGLIAAGCSIPEVFMVLAAVNGAMVFPMFRLIAGNKH